VSCVTSQGRALLVLCGSGLVILECRGSGVFFVLIAAQLLEGGISYAVCGMLGDVGRSSFRVCESLWLNGGFYRSQYEG
jgi:hypothetical protein